MTEIYLQKVFGHYMFLELISMSRRVGRNQEYPEREAEQTCSHNKGLRQFYGVVTASMSLQSCPEFRQGDFAFIPQCWQVTLCR